jgi:hypothetical protein
MLIVIFFFCPYKMWLRKLVLYMCTFAQPTMIVLQRGPNTVLNEAEAYYYVFLI